MVVRVSGPPTCCTVIVRSLGDEIRYSPAGIPMSATVKANGMLTVAEVFWATAGAKATSTRASVNRVARVVFLISNLTGAMAPNAPTLRLRGKTLNARQVEERWKRGEAQMSRDVADDKGISNASPGPAWARGHPALRLRLQPRRNRRNFRQPSLPWWIARSAPE